MLVEDMLNLKFKNNSKIYIYDPVFYLHQWQLVAVWTVVVWILVIRVGVIWRVDWVDWEEWEKWISVTWTPSSSMTSSITVIIVFIAIIVPIISVILFIILHNYSSFQNSV
ncbi:hypothetical protein D1B33_11155 [Lysinibacillus yapensis]|uniref:Uncharacterized protein n=1 Tax=Ureibacillus yapensis TaxID=2304605 RepID=A0A396SLC6_9BACL|nr:hypothetical protein D1B33_11155 [Lysinibacillus yapensis]